MHHEVNAAFFQGAADLQQRSEADSLGPAGAGKPQSW